MKKYQGGGVPAAGKPTRPARMTRSQSPESHLAAEKARLKAKRAEKYSPESRLAAEKARLQANFENREKNYINKYQKGGAKKPCPPGYRRQADGRCGMVSYNKDTKTYKYTKKDGKGKCTGVTCKERPKGLVGDPVTTKTKMYMNRPIEQLKRGGTMKSVPAGKKFNGLRSLPTGVRNKMGYAKYGSVVKGGSLRRSRKH